MRLHIGFVSKFDYIQICEYMNSISLQISYNIGNIFPHIAISGSVPYIYICNIIDYNNVVA